MLSEQQIMTILEAGTGEGTTLHLWEGWEPVLVRVLREYIVVEVVFVSPPKSLNKS
jgi:hypothetical protein